MRRQGETDGEVKRKERAVPTAGRIDQEEQKNIANCRQRDRSKEQRYAQNVKVRAEAKKVKTGDEVSGPCMRSGTAGCEPCKE